MRSSALSRGLALAAVIPIAAILTGCGGAAQPGANATQPNTTQAAGTPPAGGALTQAPATPAVTAAPAATTPASTPGGAAGSWTVKLTGSKSGAGTYTGTGSILCSASSPNGSALLWTATGMLLSAEISQISMMENPSGWDSIMVQTPGGIEAGQWFATGNLAGNTAKVTGSGNANGAHVSGHGSWTDSAGRAFTIDVAVECSNVYM